MISTWMSVTAQIRNGVRAACAGLDSRRRDSLYAFGVIRWLSSGAGAGDRTAPEGRAAMIAGVTGKLNTLDQPK